MIIITKILYKVCYGMLQYYKELLLFVKNRISDKDYAQDIVQESYMKVIALENIELIQNKRAFLYRIAKNIIVDKARKNSSVKEVMFEDSIETATNLEPETLIIEQNRQMILMQELNKLPQMRKDVFILHVLEGYSREEIAKMMDISMSAVEKHLSRASIELKAKLKNQHRNL